MSNQARSNKRLRSDAARLVRACAAWNTRLAARRITQFLDGELRPTGFSAAQLGLLALIAAADDDSLGALAVRAGCELSTLSRNLRTLEEKELVEIAAVESDLRRRAVWLTETGARRLEAALPTWQAAQRRVEQRMSADLARRLAEEAANLA